MKALQMRAFHRSLVLVLGVALAAAPAVAQPKKGDKAGEKKPEPPKGGGGGEEIEMGGDDKGGQVDPEEIDMGAPEDKPPADLSADLSTADQTDGVVKAG